LFILDITFEPETLESQSKAQKTVSNENFSEILKPNGWALGHVT